MNDKKSKLSLNDLERHLWEAAHIITGPIDASDYKTYIFPILFFKRVCDVYDEEFEEAMEFYGDEEMAKAPEQHRIEVPEGCHWNDVIAATKDVGKALKAAFLGIEKTFVHNLSNLMVGTSFPAVSDDDIMVQYVDLPEKTILPVWEDAFNRIYKSYNALKLKQERFSTFRSLLMQHLLLPNEGGAQ